MIRGALRRKTKSAYNDYKAKRAAINADREMYKEIERNEYQKKLIELKRKRAKEAGMAKARKQMKQSAGGFFSLGTSNTQTKKKRKAKYIPLY